MKAQMTTSGNTLRHAISLTMNQDSEVVIPKWLREKLGLTAGAKIQFVPEIEVSDLPKKAKARQAGLLAGLALDPAFFEPLDDEELARC